MRLDDETVFVTGAESGLGREACGPFAEEGLRAIDSETARTDRDYP